MNDEHLAFTIFAGDTKSGSTQCTDAIIIERARNMFNATEAPTVYTPGDNEWTDCHRINNGGHNNLERLAKIRTELFTETSSFGQKTMGLQHQGAPGEAYSENTRWIYGDVVFAAIHVPGSNNNKTSPADCPAANSVRTAEDCTADNVEYAARDAANIAWLQETFAIARDRGAVGVLIAIQADMWFDLPETPVNERESPTADGFNSFLATLVAETKNFEGQVVLAHGDTHFFKVDKPLESPNNLLENLTRVQTFGEGRVHWVKVTVDPNSRNVFVFEPMIVPGN
jgi:hypothetical protein